MSPEQVRGMPIDRRTDVFAIGVILYEMLTGEKLFVGETDFSTLEKVRNADVPPPRQLNPDISPGLEKVVLKALARELEDRYQWASDLQEDLMRFLLSGDAMYSGKQLAVFMKESFAEDLLREAEKMERFSSMERPDQIEVSNVGAAPRRRVTSTQAVVDRDEAPARDTRFDEDGPATEPPRAELQRYGSEYDDEDMEESQDKTQLVEEGHDLQNVLKDLRAGGGFAGQSSDAGYIDDSATSLSASPSQYNENAQAPKERTPTPARSRTSSKQQVVIGEAQGYAGETVIGPAPSSSRPEEPRSRPPVQDDEETGRRAAPELTQEDPTGPVPPARQQQQRNGRAEPVRTPPRSEPVKAPVRKPVRTEVSPSVTSGSRSRLGLVVAAAGALVVVIALGLILKLGHKPTGLLVSVSPSEATVNVNNQRVANNTLAPLPPGTYDLVATAPGHKPHTQKVKVEATESPLVVSVVLEPDPPAAVDTPPRPTPPEPRPAPTPPVATQVPPRAEPGKPETPAPAPVQPVKGTGPERPKSFLAKFFATQSGVEVLVDGKPIGKTPTAQLANLTPGRVYKVSARLPGYKPYSGEFSSKDEPELRVELPLEKEPPPRVVPPPKPAPLPAPVVAKPPPHVPANKPKGRLACSSNPAGAEIFVDGRSTGRQTPVPISNPLELPVGAHKVVFKFGGKSSAAQPIDIKAEEVSTLRNVLIE